MSSKYYNKSGHFLCFHINQTIMITIIIMTKGFCKNLTRSNPPPSPPLPGRHPARKDNDRINADAISNAFEV